MPGPALHHLMANDLKQKIMAGHGLGPGANYPKLQSLLSDSKNFPYLFLGCQGPDLLFFNVKDWFGLPYGDMLKKYHEVQEFIENFKKEMMKLVPQEILDLLDALGAAEEAIVSNSSTLTELQELFSEMGQVVDGLKTSVLEGVKAFVTEFDLYEILEHPYRDGQEKGKWWWFDAMHYRKTGDFARALLKKTPPDSPLHLYAIGYLTHVTGDTVGHAYVNVNSGGPYRTQPARHKTLENYQDVFNLFIKTGQDWNRSQLHALYNFSFDGTITPIGTDEEFEIPKVPPRMPDDLAKLIAETIAEVYESGAANDNEYGRGISPADVDAAYQLYYKWFRSATQTAALPLPYSYSLSEELIEVWETAMDNLGDIGDFLEDAANTAGNFSIFGLFIMLAALIIAAVLAAAALIDAVLGAITTLSVSAIRAAACIAYEQIYNAFLTFRLAVAFNGLAHPMQEHLGEIRFRQFMHTNLPDPFNVVSGQLKNSMPKLKVLSTGSWWQQLFHKEKHMVYPPVHPDFSEPNPIFGGPDSYYSAVALHYALGNIPLDQDFIDFLADLEGDESKLIQYMQLQFREKKRIPSIGNGVTLAGEMYDRIIHDRKIPDFNLDSDRGYAFTCWTQKDGNVQNDPEEPKVWKQHQQQDSGNPITPASLDFLQ